MLLHSTNDFVVKYLVFNNFAFRKVRLIQFTPIMHKRSSSQFLTISIDHTSTGIKVCSTIVLLPIFCAIYNHSSSFLAFLNQPMYLGSC